MQTAATSSRTTMATGAFPLRFFALAFAFTWFFWWLGVLGERGVIDALPGFTPVGAFGPLAAALVLAAREGGRDGVRSLLGRVTRWRVAPAWYAVAVLGPLALTLVTIALHVALGGRMPDPAALAGGLPAVLFASVYMLVFVALGEEVGWRGYALPALQARHGALTSSVILGSVWTLWHLPLFFNPATLYSNLPFVLFFAYLVPFSVLIAWVFNSTGGSVLIAMLVHAVMNASPTLWRLLPEYSDPSPSEAAAATVHVNVMVTVVMWAVALVVLLVYGARDLSRRPRQVPDASGDVRRRSRVR